MTLDETLIAVNSELAKRYNHFTREGNTYFFLPKGSLLTLTSHVWNKEELIIAEYADNFEEYRKGRFEDGDNFYLSDYTAKEIAKQLIESDT